MAELQNTDPSSKKFSTVSRDLDLSGFLDEVLAIFEQHKHPFIPVEECALGWMGTNVVPKEVPSPTYSSAYENINKISGCRHSHTYGAA